MGICIDIIQNTNRLKENDFKMTSRNIENHRKWRSQRTHMCNPWTWTKAGGMLMGGGCKAERDKGEKKWDNCNSIINKIYLKKKYRKPYDKIQMLSCKTTHPSIQQEMRKHVKGYLVFSPISDTTCLVASKFVIILYLSFQ